jgi:hypothetical protein
MNESCGWFCRWYRPIGALLLLLAIGFLLLRPGNVQAPVAVVPAVEATLTAPPTGGVVPTVVLPTALPAGAATTQPTALATVAPTVAQPTALPLALATLNLPAAADFTAEGVKLSGTSQPGATVELWDGATKVGTAAVGADGLWSLVSPLGEGAHKLVVRTVDAAGQILNELAAVDITVPAAIALPTLNLPATADLTAEGMKLSGQGQPGATVEVWDGATQVGTAVVGADGIWSLVAKLSGGAHWLVARTVDAAGQTLNELPAVEVTVPEALALAVAEDLTATGQAYTVRWGDWLLKLARRFYGDSRLYTRIVDGTNAKAAVDSTFRRIRNPNYIRAGQKLWIPAMPGGK